MDVLSILDILIKLVVAVVLGGIVGWQREARDRPAGLRTHVLVCVGSAVYTLTSIGFGHNADPSRVAAQVATGMGFLGAGTIIRHGNEVRGLTTAASLWTVAGIGIAVGVGGQVYWVAAMATVLVLLTLTLLRRVELRLVTRAHFATFTLRVAGGPERVPEVQQYLAAKEVRVESMDITTLPEGGQEIHVGVRVPPGVDVHQLLCEVAELPGFTALKCE